MRKLRVVLVDDEIMIREGFKKLFDWGAHDCEVVGEAADGVEALGVIDSLVPDIVIMDINERPEGHPDQPPEIPGYGIYRCIGIR